MGRIMIEYRGWTIDTAYVGYHGTHPDFDASYEDGELVGNGLQVHGMTIDQVKAEIDDKIEDLGL